MELKIKQVKIMNKIIIRNRFDGSVIFEHECENNTIKITVEQALRKEVSLYSADLRSANLSSADLSSADLRSANLSSADLYSADLRSADLSSADLSSADLRSANLSSADLRSADLRSADLRSANLSSAKNKESSYFPIFCQWSHSIIGNKIQIGCKEKTIEEWVNFFENSTEIYSTERDTQDFKQIKAVFYSYKSYLDILNS